MGLKLFYDIFPRIDYNNGPKYGSNTSHTSGNAFIHCSIAINEKLIEKCCVGRFSSSSCCPHHHYLTTRILSSRNEEKTKRVPVATDMVVI